MEIQKHRPRVVEQRWKYDEALFISIKSAGAEVAKCLSQVVQHSAMK